MASPQEEGRSEIVMKNSPNHLTPEEKAKAFENYPCLDPSFEDDYASEVATLLDAQDYKTISIKDAECRDQMVDLWDEIICPMCYRLNPQHATMDYGKGCHSCREREDWQAIRKQTGVGEAVNTIQKILTDTNTSMGRKLILITEFMAKIKAGLDDGENEY